jgi:uncharacterized damage-inducible protein DinB
VTYAPLDITSYWSHVNADLIELIDLLGEERLNWSPQPKLWNTRGILLHVCFGRHGMMSGILQDGQPVPDVLGGGQTADGLKQQLRESWERMVPFLSDRFRLDREFETEILGRAGRLNGHALVFGQIEHDIHHRADILQYLRELGIPHEEPDTLLRVLQESAS